MSVIYGLPTQTLASFRETVQWCQDQGVPRILAFPLMLLRGTAMDRQRRRWNLVEGPGDLPVVVGSDTFSYKDYRRGPRREQAGLGGAG